LPKVSLFFTVEDGISVILAISDLSNDGSNGG